MDDEAAGMSILALSTGFALAMLVAIAAGQWPATRATLAGLVLTGATAAYGTMLIRTTVRAVTVIGR